MTTKYEPEGFENSEPDISKAKTEMLYLAKCGGVLVDDVVERKPHVYHTAVVPDKPFELCLPCKDYVSRLKERMGLG